ncbi:hypothetical protein B0T14DRAFT_607829 [Immersiella caudata]|uniref:Uncharacterized protein n=1 Tax=Immersiella caudata TaxID=314043 RepID=A0AA39WB93_9PEZI|nr:hypothetical protein B0T14DRAFT_607829 [Immersiella caudata]
MCLVEVLHFLPTSHIGNIQKLATEPFTAHGRGDFVDPLGVHRCDCGGESPMLPISADSESAHLSQFSPCCHHNCCVSWTNVKYCQLFNRNADWDNGDGEIDLRQLLELQCPNYLLVNLYRSRALLGWVPDSGVAEEATDATPELNIAGIFYPNEPVDQIGDSSQDEDANIVYDALYRNRIGMMEKAAQLWLAKDNLKRVNEAALKCLEEWEYLWIMEGWYDDTMASSDACHIFHAIQGEAHAVAYLYRDFLSQLGVTLDCLGQYPEKQETWTAPDGSLSVSYGQLEMKDLTTDEILKRYSGGLLMWPPIHRWYRNLKDRVIIAAEARERYWYQRGEKRILSQDHEEGPPRKRQCVA